MFIPMWALIGLSLGLAWYHYRAVKRLGDRVYDLVGLISDEVNGFYWTRPGYAGDLPPNAQDIADRHRLELAAFRLHR